MSLKIVAGLQLQRLKILKFQMENSWTFDSQKSIEKFQVGQIWSLYSDDDGLPKYYGKIMKIDSDQGFTLRVRWLENCSPAEEIIQWHDEDMLISCGRFQTEKGRSSSFSHQATEVPTGKKGEYYILPRKGDVWALHRNWSPEIKAASELETCQYDIVEVLEEKDSEIKVLFLERVNAVFRPELKEGSAFTMQVLRSELATSGFPVRSPLFDSPRRRVVP